MDAPHPAFHMRWTPPQDGGHPKRWQLSAGSDRPTIGAANPGITTEPTSFGAFQYTER
jgi:hypothetical protein